jgi:hypothetical protein
MHKKPRRLQKSVLGITNAFTKSAELLLHTFFFPINIERVTLWMGDQHTQGPFRLAEVIETKMQS